MFSPVVLLHIQPQEQQQPQEQVEDVHAHARAGGAAVEPLAGGRSLVVAVDATQDSLAACRWVLDNVYCKGG